MFGPHLTLDLYSCNKEKLVDLDFVFHILDEMPDIIGMHKISPPNVVLYPGSPESFDQGGISGFILIAESHISIHTFVNQEYASIDIFSCKDFDLKKAQDYIIEKFEAKKVEKHLITRGRHFPRDMEKVKAIVSESRKKVSKKV